MTGLVTFFQYPFIQFREAERKQLYISPCPQSRRKSYELLYDLKQLSLDPDHPASFGNAIERALLECLHGCGLAHADRRPLCAEQERYVGVFFQFARRLQQLNKFRSRKEPPAAYMAEGSLYVSICAFRRLTAVRPKLIRMLPSSSSSEQPPIK